MTRASYFLIAITLSLCSALGAQSSYTPTCFDSSRMAYWPKPKNGDTLVVVVRTLRPLTVCARPLVRPPPPVVTPPPPVVTPVPPSNEPTGMAVITERGFSTLDTTGWYHGQQYTGARVLVSDPTAPRSPSGVVQQHFTPQLVPGSAPGYSGMRINPQPRTLYVAVWMKLSSNFVGHGSNVNKVIHFYTAGRASAQNIAIFTIRGSGTGALVPAMGLQNLAGPYRWSQPDGTVHLLTVANLEPNVASCTVTRGKWYRYEMVLTSNTPGVSDGKAELWMDGTKCLNYSGITYVASGHVSAWSEFNWLPTYGGVGGTTPTFSMSVDHMRVSGR